MQLSCVLWLKVFHELVVKLLARARVSSEGSFLSSLM